MKTALTALWTFAALLPCGVVEAQVGTTTIALAEVSEVALDDELDSLDGLDELDALDALDEDSAGGQASWFRSFGGFLSSESRIYAKARRNGQNGENIYLELEAEIDLQPLPGLQLYVQPWFLLDALDTDLLRYEPLQAYLEYSGDSWDVRAGQFIESWGIADTFNPVDVLNRRDLATLILDPKVRGELGGRFRYHFDGGEVIGQPSLSVYLMPLYRRTPLPTHSSRYAFSQTGATLRRDSWQRPELADALFLAARLEHTLNTQLLSADVQYLFARGPDRAPTFVQGLDDSGPFFVPQSFGTMVVGGGFRAIPNLPWWSKLTFKAEVVYKAPYELDTLTAELPDSYWQYAFGFDRQISGLLADNDQLTLTVEYVGEQGASDITAQFRPFQSDIVFRGFWEAGDFARSSLEVRAIVDLETGELIFEGLARSQLRFIHDDLSLLLGAQVIDASESQDSFFAIFPNNSNFRARLRFDF